MTRAELEGYAARLRATGLSFARDEVDRSGNRVALIDVPWDQVILKVMRLTGWRIVEETPKPVTTLRLEP